MKAIIAIAAFLAVDLTNAIPRRCYQVSVASLGHCPRLMAVGKISRTRYTECCCHPLLKYPISTYRNARYACAALGFISKPRPTPAPTPPRAASTTTTTTSTTTTTTTTTTTSTTTTTILEEPHEKRENMIDQFSSLWPQHSEDSLLAVDEGTNEIRVIDSNSVQEENADEGTFTFRRGPCGKFPFAVSVESKLHAGKFWRHQAGKIHLQESQDTDDICFNVVKARCKKGGFALQAANTPRKFVQKCGDKIELRTKADKCGDVKNMCWANPVSEQASLAFCETSVTKEDDVYEHPECCSHEGTLEKFGACCRENITTCKSPVRQSSLSYCTKLALDIQKLHVVNIPKLQRSLRRYPQCCSHPLFRYKYYYGRPSTGVMAAVSEICMSMIYRGKRTQAACNMPCWKINYCPAKMRRQDGWEGTNDECCCHPYRIAMKKNKINYLGTCAGLG